mgnify:FL=1
MSKAKEVEQPLTPPVQSPNEALRAAFAAMEAAQGREQSQAAEKAASQLVMETREVEEFPESESVMREIAAQARRKKLLAWRLLLEPRSHVRLLQRPPHEPQFPDEDVVVSGMRLVLTRGKRLTVPQSVATILEQAGVA